jgi:hypothetical protein
MFVVASTMLASIAVSWGELLTCITAVPGSDLTPASWQLPVFGASQASLDAAARAACEPPGFLRALDNVLITWTTIGFHVAGNGLIARIALVMSATAVLLMVTFAVSTLLLHYASNPSEDLLRLLYDRTSQIARTRVLAARTIQAAWRFARVARSAALWINSDHVPHVIFRPVMSVHLLDDHLRVAVHEWRSFRQALQVHRANNGTAPRLRILAAWADVRLLDTRLLLEVMLEAMKSAGAKIQRIGIHAVQPTRVPADDGSKHKHKYKRLPPKPKDKTA